MTEKNETRKSLFSLQVDDLIIQRIFKSLEEEIKNLKCEIRDIKDELPNLAKQTEVNALVESFSQFQIKTDKSFIAVNDRIDKTEDEFKKEMERVKKLVDDQITETIFSVNNVARAQNALIEEKVFQLSKPTVEYENLQREVQKLKDKNKQIIEETDKITKFFASFMGKDESGEQMTLDKYVDRAIQDIRDQVTNIEVTQLSFEAKAQRKDILFKRLVGTEDFEFPNYQKAEKYLIATKPKLPVCKDPTNIIDYLDFLMKFAPAVQKAMSLFYNQICALSNKFYDREEKELSFENLQQRIALLNQMEIDIAYLKDHSMTQEQYDLIKSALEENGQNNGKSNAKNEDLQAIILQLMEIEQNYVPKQELEKTVSEFNKNLDQAVTNAIIELKDAIDIETSAREPLSAMDSYRSRTDDNPAIAAVTPRGTASYKMIYKQSPSTTRVIVPRKEEIEEVGRHPKRTQKTPSRINLPLDSIPQPQSAKSVLANRKRFD